MKNTCRKATRRTFLGATIGAGAGGAIVSSAIGKERLSSQSTFHPRVTIDLGQTGLRRIAVDIDGHVVIVASKIIQKRNSEGAVLSESSFERPIRCVTTRGTETMVGIRDHVRVLNRDGRVQHWLPTIGDGHLVGDVVVDGDSIIVTDITASTLKRFCASGRWETIASRKTGFTLPVGGRLTLTADGFFAMTNPGRHRVELLGPKGECLSSWGKRTRDESGFQGCCNPLSAISLADGTMVTAEAGQVRLKQFDTQGNLIQQIAGPETFDVLAVTGENDEPTYQQLPCAAGGIDLAVGSDETLWMLHAAAKQLIGLRATERA